MEREPRPFGKEGSSERRPESPDEQEHGRERAESLDARISSAERELVDAEDRLNTESEDRVFTALAENGVTKEEAFASPKVREALGELKSLRGEAASATLDAMSGLTLLKTRFKRLVVGAGIVLSTLAPGAAMAEGRPDAAAKEPGIELVQEKDAKAAFDRMRDDTIERLRGDTKLAEEIGKENVAVIEETLRRYDPDAINGIITRLGGLDPDRVRGEYPKGFVFHSEQGLREAAKDGDIVAQSLLDPNVTGLNSYETIHVIPGRRLDDARRLSGDSLLHVLTHEHVHGAFSKDDAPSEMVRAIPTLQEGSTERITDLILSEQGIPMEYQSYGGGTLASGYVLEQILGTETFVQTYFEGRSGAFEEALTEKLGKEAAHEITQRQLLGMAERRLSGNEEAMLTLQSLFRHARNAGMDIESIAERAAGRGLIEHIDIDDDGDLIVLSKRSKEGDLTQDVIYDTGARLHPHGHSFKVSIETRRNNPSGVPLEKADKQVSFTAAKISKEMENLYVQAYHDNLQGGEGSSMAQMRLERQFQYQEFFTATLEVPEAWEELNVRYRSATTDQEREAIRDQASELLKQHARAAAAVIRAKVISSM